MFEFNLLTPRTLLHFNSTFTPHTSLYFNSIQFNSLHLPVTTSENNVHVNDLGMQFAHQYYTCLSREPARLPSFYTKTSTLLHGDEGDLEAPIAVGAEAIQAALAKSPFTGCRFIIQNIDCHPSLNGGVMINVLGQVQQGKSSLPTATRSFAQSFFLVEQPTGYFVLNDNLRFLQTAPVTEQQQQQQAATKAASANETAAAAAAAQSKAEAKSEEVKDSTVAPVAPTATATETETANGIETATVAATTAAAAMTESDAQSVPAKQVKKMSTKAAAAKASKSSPEAASNPTSPVKPVIAAAAQEEEEPLPTGPSSWAQLAAVQQNKWASGVVAPAKGTSIVESAPAKKQPQQQPRNSNEKQQQQQQQQRPTSTTAAAPAQKKLPFSPEAALFVTGVTEELKWDAVNTFFSSLGPLTHFDINRKMGVAFVEYEDPAIAKLVLENGTVTVDGVQLTVEKRRVYKSGHGSVGNKKGDDGSSQGSSNSSNNKKFTPTNNGRRRNAAPAN